MEIKKWHNEARLFMIDKSEFYSDPKVYQFGFYDGYNKALKDSKANEMLDMLKSNLLILNNTLSYIENIERYVPMCDRSKFNTNVKLIDNKIKQIEQLIKQATEL